MGPVTKFQDNPPESRTLARQGELPLLPIPPLEDTLKRYLRALEGLQDRREHEATKRAVEEFLHGDGPRVQEKLREYAKDKARCVRPEWALDGGLRASPVPADFSGAVDQLHRRVLVRVSSLAAVCAL